MEQRKRDITLETTLLITRNEKAQQRDTEILKNLPALRLGSEITASKIAEIRNKMAERTNDIKTLQKKLLDISNGILDAEIIVELAEQQKAHKKIQDKNIQKQKERKKEASDKNDFLNSKTKDIDPRQLARDYHYYQRIEEKIKESIPDYMHDNLREMPSNKGYIWRGMWLFGKRPEEKGQPLLMFEKKGPVMVIHEIDEYEHRIYEKKGKDKKVLISRKRRRIIKCKKLL